MAIETRPAKLVLNKSSRGSSTFRATIPTNWVRKMGLGEEKRDVKLGFDGETVTIRRDEDGE